MSDAVGPLSISVVIPVRDGAHLLGPQLEALASQEHHGPWEVVIADNGSTDDLAGAVRPFEDRLSVSIVDAGRVIGINAARNVGVQAASGEFLLFCDCDDVVHPGWLAAYHAAAAEGALLVGGALAPVSDSGEVFLDEIATVPLVGGLGFLRSPTGANCGVHRSVYDDIGAFDETYRGGGDETDFYWRAQLAGYPLTAVPEAVVSYTQRSTTSGVWRQSVGYGRSHVKLYVRFAPAGMPRRHGVHIAARLVKNAAIWTLVPARRGVVGPKLVSVAGVAAGRLAGSLEHRVAYL